MGGPARKKQRTSKTKMSHNKIDDARLPVTLLSGFLGSGKTTLLQTILQNKQGLKVRESPSWAALLRPGRHLEQGGVRNSPRRKQHPDSQQSP
jgi:hypothetical protein